MHELGQILPESEFGGLLTQLARKSSVIVEIGTWWGEGSTRCLQRGLVRPDQKLFLIESHEPVFTAAKARYKEDPRMIWILGTVTVMNDTPIIIEQLPAQIDLLLIDGGEDNGWLDFEALNSRCKIIALDDTREPCRKGVKARQMLLEWGWVVLADKLDDRNGWAVFERPNRLVPESETC